MFVSNFFIDTTLAQQVKVPFVSCGSIVVNNVVLYYLRAGAIGRITSATQRDIGVPEMLASFCSLSTIRPNIIEVSYFGRFQTMLKVYYDVAV